MAPSISALPGDSDVAEASRPISYIRRFLPESLLRGEPRESGVELLECSDGVEARAWRAGALYASSWWPQMPDATSWMAFCRGAGVAPQPLPSALSPAWRDQPWTLVRGHSLRDTLTQYQRLAIPGALALVLLVAAWQVSALLHVQLGRMQLDRDIAASSQKVSDILTARNRAEDDLAVTRKLLTLRPPVPQLQLMATVSRILDPMKATIVQWTMPNPTTLEVVVAMNAPDPRALVLAFQQTHTFDDVSVDMGRNSKDQVIMRARIRPSSLTAAAAGGPGPS